MPRQKNSGRKTRGVRQHMIRENRTVPAEGRVYYSTSVSQVVGTLTITEINLTVSQLGDRLLNIADTYAYWRLVGLRVDQILQAGYSGLSTPTSDHYIHGVTFIPQASGNYTAPTTLAQLVDFPEFSQGNGLQTVRISVGRQGLINSQPSKWLSTGTAGDTQILSAGVVTLFSACGSPADTTANGILRTVISFSVEFKGPIDGTLNPALEVKVLPSRSYSEKVAPDPETEDDRIDIDVKEEKFDVVSLRSLPQMRMQSGRASARR